VNGDLLGDIQIEKYNEFLNKPYINVVKARQIVDPPVGMLDAATELVEEL